jgi:transposase
VSGLGELDREELIALVLKLHETVECQSKRILELEEEVARLRGGRPSVPLWVKPNAAKNQSGPRKKRKKSFVRKNVTTDRVVCHAFERCPECDRKLDGGSVKFRHQVMDLPRAAVEVTDHVFLERRCGVCGKRWTVDPRLALAGVVVGRKRFGIELMSLIAHLKTVCRMPIGQICKLLESLYGLRISSGEVAEILHDVAELGSAEYDALLSRIRGSSVVHGDETGWREAGENGFLWSFSNPEVRYYLYRKSRASPVVKEVLAEEFAGTLVTDFLGSYNIYDGPKQRCWVHLIRDLDELSERNPDLRPVTGWVDRVKRVYHRAKATREKEIRESERIRLRISFEDELSCLCKPYVGAKTAPQRVLAKRMVWFLKELFTFVEYPEAPSENNAAERAIRPAVVARKISGGTRSARGSKTATILRSLFETWGIQGRNTIDACRDMIIQAASTVPSTAQ